MRQWTVCGVSAMCCLRAFEARKNRAQAGRDLQQSPFAASSGMPNATLAHTLFTSSAPVTEELHAMTHTYVSKIISHPADAVWAVVKDFNEYRWGAGVGEARIENGIDANTPGAIRSFAYYDRPSRQRLLAYSARERMQSWESVQAFDATLSYYKATLRITPVTTSDSSFVEWWSDFEATPEATPEWSSMQRREFAKSLDRLASIVDGAPLSTALYSTVLDSPIETVWSVIRDFNNYPAYIDGVTESVIEDERRGDEVGAIRRFRYHGHWIRQRLAAHSDEQRSLTYVGMEPFAYPASASAASPAPVRYEGTMHVLPIVDGARTLIEWSVAFDAAPGDVETWRSLLLTLIPEWTESLRRALTRGQDSRAAVREAAR
jgi:hypothetical protein